jgi:hypothetical protein
MDLHLVRSQAEATFGCSLDEFLVDFGKTKRPSMSLQKVSSVFEGLQCICKRLDQFIKPLMALQRLHQFLKGLVISLQKVSSVIKDHRCLQMLNNKKSFLKLPMF